MAGDIASLIRQIARRQGLTPAQTAALLATAKVESGLRPDAVGDGGTSYGLFQHHVGGAGGSSHEQARRFLDPVTSITERAKWFKRNNITNGQLAAALQRPADPAGYARKVNAALKGLGASLNAPVSSLGMGEELPGLPAATGPDPRQARIAGLQSARERLAPKKAKEPVSLGIGEDDVAGFWTQEKPDLRSRTNELRSARTSLKAAMAPPEVAAAEASGVSVSGPSAAGVDSYKDILRIGSQFGLRIDGSNQTTGGRHAPGSYHYAGRAVDFGDAKNSPEKLRALAAWARKNAPRIKEFFYDPLGWYIKDGKIIKGSIGGHGDHVHIAM